MMPFYATFRENADERRGYSVRTPVGRPVSTSRKNCRPSVVWVSSARQRVSEPVTSPTPRRPN
jgi:hypothetical protein